MNKEEFANTFIKIAFGAILADGIVADEEIESLQLFAKDDFYLKDFDLEQQIEYYKNKFDARGYLMIRNILNEIPSADLEESQKLILIDVAIDIIRADNIIKKDEIDYINQLISNLKIPKFIVNSRHSDWWLMDKKSNDDLEEENKDK